MLRVDFHWRKYILNVICNISATLFRPQCIPIIDGGLQIYGLVQDCSNSSALAMELLQSYT